MIFPKPKHEVYRDGVYNLKEPLYECNLLCLYNKCKNGTSDIKLLQSGAYEEEKYGLEINEEGISITYGTNCGIFRAVSSLRQLRREYGTALPFCEIEDFPDFPKRGYMLDISRGRIPKVNTICTLINLLAALKYNEFELYMEGIVYKYEAFPHITKDIDCLTPKNIEFLDAYCKERFISLIPNQNSFGHLSHWLNRDEFLHLKVGGKEDIRGNLNPSSTINPLLPESLEFMDKLYGSLLPHFSSDSVNIGLDEAFGMGTCEIEEACRKYGEENVFMDWLIELHGLIKSKYNKKIRFWADMIVSHPQIYKRIPADATALLWAYDMKSNAFQEKRCIELAESKTKFYVCPGDATWVALTGRFDVMNFNARHMAELGKKYGASGYLYTNWGSGGHPHFPVWTFVPCAVGGQYAWNTETSYVWWMNSRLFKEAGRFIEAEMFNGAKVSEILYRLQRYYLQEPECLHSGTLAAYALNIALDTPVEINDFKLEDYSGKPSYFNNVICHVKTALADLEHTKLSEKWKQQIICNAEMVIFSEELCKIRVDKTVSDEKIDELLMLAEHIINSFNVLWDEENYTLGKEITVETIKNRAEELKSLYGKNILVLKGSAAECGRL